MGLPGCHEPRSGSPVPQGLSDLKRPEKGCQMVLRLPWKVAVICGAAAGTGAVSGAVTGTGVQTGTEAAVGQKAAEVLG